jgi:hypothetical protein
MDKNNAEKKGQSTPKNAGGPADRDDRGTPIERAPGPGPKDDGKGALGKEAKDRLERKH